MPVLRQRPQAYSQASPSSFRRGQSEPTPTIQLTPRALLHVRYLITCRTGGRPSPVPTGWTAGASFAVALPARRAGALVPMTGCHRRARPSRSAKARPTAAHRKPHGRHCGEGRTRTTPPFQLRRMLLTERVNLFAVTGLRRYDGLALVLRCRRYDGLDDPCIQRLPAPPPPTASPTPRHSAQANPEPTPTIPTHASSVCTSGASSHAALVTGLRHDGLDGWCLFVALPA